LHDAEVLEWAVESKAKYVGMIGSRAKVRILFRDLESKGFKKESLAKVHAPIGLDIKAETPEEIALSITAELVLVRRQRQQINHDHKIVLKKVVPKSGPAGWA
jgi:xanthine dehydrogenase accessory factor